MLIDLDAPPAERVVRRRPRYEALALVVLLLAPIGAEAAPPRAAELAVVADSGGRPVTTTLLTPDALYTEHDSELRAQPLVPGGPGWTRALLAGEPELARVGDTLIVRPGEAIAEVLFLDVSTGRARWQAPWDAQVAEAAADRVVVWEQDPANVVPGRLRLADLATGRPIWSRVADGGMLHVDRPGGRVVSVNYDGVASIYRLADGRPIVENVRLTGDRVGQAPKEPPGELKLTPASGRTLVTRFGDARTLGTVPPVDPRTCQQAGPYLGCRTAGGTVTVWRVRR
ncbi:MAG: PQQ-binding-like beta-propeller repeat protein [Actinoplanes sp.]